MVLAITALLAVCLRVAAASPPPPLPDLSDPERTGQTAPKDAAVVIGVEGYSYVPHVPYARRDAEAFETFILYTRGVPLDRVRMLKDARAYEIEDAIRAAGQEVGPGGTVWVYFAGHGAMDPNGSRRLLLGSDAATDPSAFARFAVAVDDVRTWATAGGGQAMLVLDACYNGGGRTGDTVLGGGRRFAVPDYALAPSPSSTEWAATAPSELAAPFDAAQHGAFTYFAIGALRGWADGEVDGRRDGNVTTQEASEYVVRALRAVLVTGQTPQMSTIAGGASVISKGVREAGPDAETLLLFRPQVPAPPDPDLRAPASTPSLSSPNRHTRGSLVLVDKGPWLETTTVWLDGVCGGNCSKATSVKLQAAVGSHLLEVRDADGYMLIRGMLTVSDDTGSKLRFSMNCTLQERRDLGRVKMQVPLVAQTDARVWEMTATTCVE